MLVELCGGDSGGVGDLAGVGEALSGQSLAAEHPPPRLVQVQPAGPFRDEHLLDARVFCQPCAGALAGVAAEVVGDDHDGAGGVGFLQLAFLIMDGVLPSLVLDEPAVARCPG